MKEIGRLLGFASKNVEIRNIVVGDLPFSRRGDFFISIQCANNPDQVTSVAEDKDPKVVHFPEAITLRIRESSLEARLKITVKELNVLGFQEICEVHMAAENVIDWHSAKNPTERIKRFEMKPLDVDFETETQPWILIEFGSPTESRELDNLRATPDVVRTVNADHVIEDATIVDFKYKYQLVDSGGHMIQEPDESDIQDIRNLRHCLVWGVHCFNSVIFTILVIYCIFRFYLYSCYQQYSTLTMAILERKSFPMSTVALQDLKDSCFEKMDGTGLPEGSSPCRPTGEQILTTCHHLPPNQPRPGAGKVYMKKWFGLDVDGVTCSFKPPHRLQVEEPIASPMNATLGSFPPPVNVSISSRLLQSNDTNASSGEPVFLSWIASQMNMNSTNAGVCEIRNKIVPWDHAIIAFGIVLILSTFFVRMCGNQMIRRAKANKQKQRAEVTKEVTAKLMHETQTKRYGR